MARFEISFVVVLLLSIVCCSVKCGLIYSERDELSTETSRTTRTTPEPEDEDRTLRKELDSVYKRLSRAADLRLDDMVMNDQPRTDGQGMTVGPFQPPNHDAIKQQYTDHFKNKLLALTDHADMMQTSSTPPSIPMLPFIDSEHSCKIPSSYSDSRYECEAIPPICPILNGKNLTVKFNLSDPQPTSKDKVLKVDAAQLQLKKIPLKDSKFLQNDDEPVVDEWKTILNRSDIVVSDQVIRSKVNEESMIRVTVYKIRNRNKTQELKLLDTKMIKASFEGLTSWNVKGAVNIWGNETRKTLKLVIKVDDGKGHEIPTQSVFDMRCENDFDKPSPIYIPSIQSNKSHTAWINLGTVEVPAKTEALKGVASSIKYEQGTRRHGPEGSLTLDDE